MAPARLDVRAHGGDLAPAVHPSRRSVRALDGPSACKRVSPGCGPPPVTAEGAAMGAAGPSRERRHLVTVRSPQARTPCGQVRLARDAGISVHARLTPATDDERGPPVGAATR